MNCHFKFTCIFIFGLLCLTLYSSLCLAEELEPRRWTHLPINTNFIGGGFAHTDADISFDPVLKIEEGQVDLHTWVAKYIRTFTLFDRTARVDLLQGYQKGRWTGLLDGVATTVRRSGWTDTRLNFVINLYGAPPLQGKEYAAYRAAIVTETIVGVGLSIQLPTGDYMDDKLINLGTNRFTCRPQVGLLHSRGNWSLEVTGVVELYTDNTDFFNGQKLENDPLYVIHSHLVYNFRPGVWTSLSSGYDYGGSATVDGVKKDNRKQNIGWAISLGFPVTRNLGFKLAYIGTRTQESTGIDSDTYAAGFSAFW